MERASASVKEARFYRALRDVFVGAKVEGESGYINLMAMKSRYYENGVFPKLRQDIEDALKAFPDPSTSLRTGFREELFDKLYSFFSRYFSESGSMYFRYTPLHQNVYERVYTDDKDVMLFWKTHALYYVKTDRLFRNLEVELDGLKCFFDVSGLEHKKANEKREIIYEFKTKRDDGTLVFAVAYSEKGRKTKIDEMLRELRKQGVNLTPHPPAPSRSEAGWGEGEKGVRARGDGGEVLERAFRVFERQSEVDYFINKNAKAFLLEQFNLWLYQYVFSGESEWTEKRIKQLQTLKDIAFKIIDFISQFEDELVKIWNKPKFVLNANYVITLDRIAERDMELAEKLLEHENLMSQVEEWKALGIVEDGFRKSDVVETNLLGKHLCDRYRYLPIDTRHFKDVELEILGLFEDLDAALDGWLIKSENYQALNTLLPKFRERVKVTYIDPPYNTGSDGFIYNDQFQHASWLTMMENRLALARELMRDDGVFFTHIDENEQFRLRILLETEFGNENYLAPLIWISRAGKGGTATKIQIGHEHIESVAKRLAKVSLKSIEKVIEECPYQDEKGRYKRELLRQWGGQHDRREDRPTLYFPIPTPFGIEVYPKRRDGTDGNWRFSREKVMRMLEIDDLDFVQDENTGEITVYRKIREGRKVVSVPSNLLDNVGTSADGTKDIQSLFGEKVFDTTKPRRLAQRLIELVSWQTEDSDLILDFFAGSGTTAHAVINLNRQDGGRRKYILVEMADYFETVLLPRIKKAVFCEKWKDGKPAGGEGVSQMVKYYELEQYEDTLRKAKYEDADLFENPYRDPYHQYVFLRDVKMLDALEVDLNQNRVKVDPSKLYENIDIAETLSNLRGQWIKRITPDFVEFEDGERVDIVDLDWKLIKPLIWW
ncbi:site-specific DNA-methyltransferase [Candidatus Poribacteria bacterium]|nr:site-specific DNA-methyltransferase [Candidatus Poribacteria bacterium]